MSKIIAIIGATGAQGGSVATEFLKLDGWKVRAITRNASSDKAKALQSQGAEVVTADCWDEASLVKAFEAGLPRFLFGSSLYLTPDRVLPPSLPSPAFLKSSLESRKVRLTTLRSRKLSSQRSLLELLRGRRRLSITYGRHFLVRGLRVMENSLCLTLMGRLRQMHGLGAICLISTRRRPI
jgi:hypothetical protein